MNRPLNIVFAGTPEFAASALEALIHSPHRVVAVYTQPDRPAGRGRRLTPSAVKRLAQAHGLPVHQPVTLRDETVLRALRDHGADLMVVAAYGLILPPEALGATPLGAVNIHASLLPRWRGAAPIQRAILTGDRETGITLMQMDEGLDTGAILAQRAIPIGEHETAGELHDRLARLGAELLLEALPALAEGRLPPRPQDESQASYAAKLEKGEARLDWRLPAEALARRVRAFNPWPVAHTTLDGQPLRIWQARPLPGTGEAGVILDAGREGITVGCGEGRLRLEEIQLPGKRRMAAADLANARRLPGLYLGDGAT